MTLNKRIFFQVFCVLIGTIFLLFLWRTSIFRISKNFYEIDPGKFYRSAQLSPSELEDVIKKYGIKTVISLRGAPDDSYWVPGQVRVLKENHVDFYPLWWTIDFFPQNQEIKKYAQLLETAPRPILVHCRTGADRTGEATALYAIDFMGQSATEAIDNYLNFKYWHVQSFHPAKAEFVRQWKGHKWALDSYDLCQEFPQWAEPGICPQK